MAVAILAAIAVPARAAQWESATHDASGTGPDGSWSAASNVASDGTFSLAVSSRDDRAAAVNDSGARATASVRVAKPGPVLTPGTYVVTATITDWESSNQATDHGGASVYFVGGVDCGSCNAVTASEGTSETPGQLTRTTYWVVTETVQTTLFALVDASAGVGTSIYDDTLVLGSIGSASASASGVFQPITVRPV